MSEPFVIHSPQFHHVSRSINYPPSQINLLSTKPILRGQFCPGRVNLTSYIPFDFAYFLLSLISCACFNSVHNKRRNLNPEFSAKNVWRSSKYKRVGNKNNNLCYRYECFWGSVGNHTNILANIYP